MAIQATVLIQQRPEIIDTSQGQDLNSVLGALYVLSLTLSGLLLGNLVVFIGVSLVGFRRPEISLPNRTRRAHRIGKTANPMLIELLREAENRLDLVGGLIGSIPLYVAAVLILRLDLDFLSSNDATVPWWLLLLTASFTALIMWWLYAHATSLHVALDQCLDELE
ncbi:hypothetical protein V8J36_01885 [Frigidibacter sp. MR17.14]|uniref:hypothetical protein n=1 Tax=Frigidibacter sp. MR17.14 TaxID=3126509 RepID=UPI003013084F